MRLSIGQNPGYINSIEDLKKRSDEQRSDEQLNTIAARIKGLIK